MGSLQNWHALIILVLGMLIYAVPVAIANNIWTLTRRSYLGRFVMVVFVGAVLELIVETADKETARVLVYLIDFALSMLLVVWSVYRTRDIGWSKWWCLLYCVPLVNFLYGLVIMFVPSGYASQSGAGAYRASESR